jgi:hypothetical protein
MLERTALKETKNKPKPENVNKSVQAQQLGSPRQKVKYGSVGQRTLRT